MRLQNTKFIIVSTIVFMFFIECQSSTFVPQFYAPIERVLTAYLPSPSSLKTTPTQLIRSQRSIYESGWNGGGHTIPISPVNLGQITKDELIALLEAWKEIESGAAEKPEPEPAPEPELEPTEAPAKPEPEAKLPPPGVPLTVSLPAFVPIQLSAMYTAPVPAAPAPAPAAAPAAAPVEAPEAAPAPEPQPEPEPIEPAAPPAPVKEIQTTLFKIYAQPKPLIIPAPRPAAPPKKAPARPKPLAAAPKPLPKPKGWGPILHPSGSSPRYYSAPPPPFLSHVPGPLKLVPSSQLLSNWD